VLSTTQGVPAFKTNRKDAIFLKVRPAFFKSAFIRSRTHKPPESQSRGTPTRSVFRREVSEIPKR